MEEKHYELLIARVLLDKPDDLIPMISWVIMYLLIVPVIIGYINVVQLLIVTVLQHNPADLMPMINSGDYYSLRWSEAVNRYDVSTLLSNYI